MKETTKIPSDFYRLPISLVCPSPTWDANIPGFSNSLSQTYLHRHTKTMRLTFCTPEAVLGVEIPSDETPSDALLLRWPRLFELFRFGDMRWGTAFASGYSGTVFHRKPSLYMLNYSWSEETLREDQDHSNFIVVSNGRARHVNDIAAFDEGSGRAVVGRYLGEILVLDFSRAATRNQ
jgi:hypothetical protein